MDALLKQVELDEAILLLLKLLCRKRSSENLELYRKKIKTRQQALYCIFHVDEIRKAKTKVVMDLKRKKVTDDNNTDPTTVEYEWL